MERPEGSPPLGGVEELVRAAQGGDALAMAALLRELAPRVGRICGSIALDDGEDAMQETFIAVFRHLPGLREPAALYGWVRRIAVRESLRIARHGDVPTSDEWLSAVSAPRPDTDTVLDVRATLDGLTPEHRAVLVLRDLEGMSEAETAKVLDIAEGTVKSRLHRARATFQRRWSA
jgi:RNA polymerase sigma-70 factor (ECF subfamily)